MAGESIHELVNSGNGEGVFWTCLVEVCIVDANLPLSIGLFDHDDICKPVRIVHFPDELGCEVCIALWIELTVLLYDQFVRVIHV